MKLREKVIIFHEESECLGYDVPNCDGSVERNGGGVLEYLVNRKN